MKRLLGTSLWILAALTLPSLAHAQWFDLHNYPLSYVNSPGPDAAQDSFQSIWRERKLHTDYEQQCDSSRRS
jgi:hypothetical protein